MALCIHNKGQPFRKFFDYVWQTNMNFVTEFRKEFDVKKVS